MREQEQLNKEDRNLEINNEDKNLGKETLDKEDKDFKINNKDKNVEVNDERWKYSRQAPKTLTSTSRLFSLTILGLIKVILQ